MERRIKFLSTTLQQYTEREEGLNSEKTYLHGVAWWVRKKNIKKIMKILENTHLYQFTVSMSCHKLNNMPYLTEP